MVDRPCKKRGEPGDCSDLYQILDYFHGSPEGTHKPSRMPSPTKADDFECTILSIIADTDYQKLKDPGYYMRGNEVDLTCLDLPENDPPKSKT